MSEYAVMPLADYQDACEAVKEKIGSTERITSGQMAALIRSITGGEDLTQVLAEQDTLIEQIMTALEGKAAGSGSTEPDPSELYQRVEYIESAESETYPYIITDIYADTNTGVEVIASFPVLQDRIPMGSRNDTGSTRFYCAYPLSTTGSYYGFNGGYSMSGSFAVNTKYRCQTNFLNCRMAGMYNSSGKRLAGGLIDSTVTLQTQLVPIAIFGYNYGYSGAVTSKREYKLYSARISQGLEIVREYIPCYRKSDGVVGLYEKFTGAFLTAESGVFAKGADIDWEVAA